MPIHSLEQIKQWGERISLIAPELEGVNPESVMSPLMPGDVGWEIIDIRDPDGNGAARFTQLKNDLITTKHEHKIKLRPYDEAVSELGEHIAKLTNSQLTPEQSVEYVVNYLLKHTKKISREDILSVVSHGSIAEDVTWLSGEFKSREITPNSLSEHSVWLHNIETGELVKWVDRDTHNLMQMARLVGLIPFDTIRKLRDAKIVVAGSSASAKTIDLLVSLGAQNIHVWDNGKVSPVKLPLYPGWMGTIAAVGEYKSVALKKQCLGRSPFINFQAHTGLVLKDQVSIESDDVSFKDLIVGARFIIECVDSPEIKTQLREWLAQYAPDLSTIFIADIENRPTGGNEKPGMGQHFHQKLSHTMIEAMSIKPTTLQEALSQVYHMLKKELPFSHGNQFIYYLAGLATAWSQSGIASSESAIIASELILADLQGLNVHDKNYNSKTTPNQFNDPSTVAQRKIIGRIYKQIFKLSV